MRRFMVEAVPLFERESGNKVALRFGPTRELKKEIEEGAAFDVALLPRWAVDQLVAAGKIAAGTPTDAVRSLVGFVTRAGASKPDIGTVEALKNVLRQARSISYSRGPSGEYVAELIERLGLAAEMKDKTVFAIGRRVAEVVAKGEAEVGMQQIIEILPVEGPLSLARCQASCETTSSTPPGSPQTPRIGRRRVPLWGFLPPPRWSASSAPRVWSRGDP